MSMAETEDPLDGHRPLGATGILRAFSDAGLLEAADVHVAGRLTTLAGESSETVALAVALAVRAVRHGSVCVDLTKVATDSGAAELPWPPLDDWSAALRASPLLGPTPVLRLSDDHLLYLDRYWREEEQVCTDLQAMATKPLPTDDAALTAGLDRVFPAAGYDEQRDAARIALSQWMTVLTGGPGTGKTTTVAALLALLAEQAELAGKTRPRIALAAPTGKAAARLQEAVGREVDKLGDVDRTRLHGLQAVTLHRLLGSRPDSSARFRHHRDNRLPDDVIVVDEASMVSLTMMARLLEAVRPTARLILVGDPHQLASVDAGAVLADLVDGLGGLGGLGGLQGLESNRDVRIAALTTSHRFGESIGALANTIRLGDTDGAVELLRAGGRHIEWLDDDADSTATLRAALVPHALRIREAALLGDAPAALTGLDSHRLLCAHREGPHGVRHWNRQVERWLSEETGQPIWTSWYVGRPLLVTANDYRLRLFNGDTGVAVQHDGVLRAVIGGATGTLDFAISRLADVDTMHAMTIHKSQGSQADEVTVLLPSENSRLLSRELLYTAVTRAKSKIRVVGSEGAVRAALGRRAVRASGLRQRL